MESVKQYIFPFTVECVPEGGYYAECPILPGCHVEGGIYAEAIENLEDAIQVFLRSYREIGKPIPAVPLIDRHTVVSSGIPVAVRRGA